MFARLAEKFGTRLINGVVMPDEVLESPYFVGKRAHRFPIGIHVSSDERDVWVIEHEYKGGSPGEIGAASAAFGVAGGLLSSALLRRSLLAVVVHRREGSDWHQIEPMSLGRRVLVSILPRASAWCGAGAIQRDGHMVRPLSRGNPAIDSEAIDRALAAMAGSKGRFCLIGNGRLTVVWPHGDQGARLKALWRHEPLASVAMAV